MDISIQMSVSLFSFNGKKGLSLIETELTKRKFNLWIYIPSRLHTSGWKTLPSFPCRVRTICHKN